MTHPTARKLRFSVAVLGTLLAIASTASSKRNATPPTSLAPRAKSVQVRIRHLHRAIRSCTQQRTPPTCAGREEDGNTAAVVDFEPGGTVNASLHPHNARVRVAFPVRQGQQEQAIVLTAGEWLVDWQGSGQIQRLRLEVGEHPLVTLTTRSGSCEHTREQCQLVPGVRSRRLSIADGASAG